MNDASITHANFNRRSFLRSAGAMAAAAAAGGPAGSLLADLAPAAVAYTRRVTQVWCGFFVFNGAVSLGTALWGSPAAWALYNGLLAYVLMGVLFGGEWLLRQRVKARIAAGEAHV